MKNSEKKTKRTRTARSNNTQFMIRIILIVLIALLASLCVALSVFKIFGLDDLGTEQAKRVENTIPNPDEPIEKDGILYYPQYDENGVLTCYMSEDGVKLTDDTGAVINADNMMTKDPKYNFLLLGQDKKAMLTDVMMLINFDAKNGKISIMQFPRDTYIEVSSKACLNCMKVPNNAQNSANCSTCGTELTTVGNGYGQKMNSVYNTYYSALKRYDSGASEKELTLFGAEGLASEIERNLNINIDYQVHMDLEGFRDIVDAIGGVDMYVPYDMDYEDPYQDLYIHLDEGQQNLDGEKAEQFVRFRKSYINGDLGRQDAQKLFMVAFFKNFKEKVSVTNVFSIVSSMMKHVTHTVPISDLDYFGRQALSMDFSNITMLSAPNTPHTINGASYVVLHKQPLYEVVNEHFNLLTNGIKIPLSSFDRNKNFTIENDSAVNAIYETTKEFEGEKTAEDIENNGIDISRAY